MRKLLILIAVLAPFGAAPALAATGDLRIGLQLGPSAPAGELEKFSDAGFASGLMGTYMASERVGIGADAAFHFWFDSYGVAVINAVQATAHALYDFRTDGWARPYARVGFGAYRLETYALHGIWQNSETERRFGYNVGGGVDFIVGARGRVGIGATVHIIPDAGPFVTVGVNLIGEKAPGPSRNSGNP